MLIRTCRTHPPRTAFAPRARCEPLEARRLLTGFVVTSGANAGPGTLRQAILDANADPGRDTIRFDLTGSIQPTVQLPDITEAVDVDGSAAPGVMTAPATVRISGENVVRTGLRLVNAGGSVIRGLTLVRFRNSAIEVDRSDGVVIEGNRIGLDGATAAGGAIGVHLLTGNGCRVGGPDPAQANVISGNVVGVRVDSRQNVIEGNDIGTLAGGGFDPRVGNTDSGVLVAGNADGDKANVVRNNRVAGNLNGITLEAHGNFVRGNTVEGNGVGVVVRNAERNQVGGDAPADGNRITANRRDGIFLTNGNDTLIRHNTIGTPAFDRPPVGNGDAGVSLSGSAGSNGNRILDNFIGDNGKWGVLLMVGRDNAILSNTIVGNGLMPIDLGGDGATPNDPGDADDGGNGRQNFPVLTSATSDGSGTTVTGTIDSLPVLTYRVEFFSTPGVDNPTGAVLGSVDVTTSSSGAAAFSAKLPSVQAGAQIVATATRLVGAGGGETSEFSAAAPITPAPGTRGPHVVGVFVRGTEWADGFVNALGPYGYAVPGGPQQLAPLPWVNLDQVTVRFSEPVAVGDEALAVHAAVGDGVLPQPGYVRAAVAYADGGRTVTWTLQSPIGADRVELDLGHGEVRDAAGTELDGEWVDGGDAWPSGDGTPGGDFRMRLNVLPGDADRSGAVLANDFAEVKKRFFRGVASPGAGDAAYTVFHDVNGSGTILADDFAAVKRRFFSTLPAAAPASAASSAAPATSRTRLRPAISLLA